MIATDILNKSGDFTSGCGVGKSLVHLDSLGMVFQGDVVEVKLSKFYRSLRAT